MLRSISRVCRSEYVLNDDEEDAEDDNNFEILINSELPGCTPIVVE